MYEKIGLIAALVVITSLAWAPWAVAQDSAWPRQICAEKSPPKPGVATAKIEADFVERTGNHEVVKSMASEWIDLSHQNCVSVGDLLDEMRGMVYVPKRVDQEIAFFARDLVYRVKNHAKGISCDTTIGQMGSESTQSLRKPVSGNYFYHSCGW